MEEEEWPEEKLNEEFSRSLVAMDPTAPNSVSRFCFREGNYKKEDIDIHTKLHYSWDGTIVPNDSDEARPAAPAGMAGADEPSDDDDDDDDDEEEEAPPAEANPAEAPSEEAPPSDAPPVEGDAPPVDGEVHVELTTQ